MNKLQNESKPRRFAYSFAETAESLGVSRPYVYQLIEAGELESFRLGRRHLITADSVANLVTRKSKGAA